MGVVSLKRWVESERPCFVARHMDWFDFFPGKRGYHKKSR